MVRSCRSLDENIVAGPRTIATRWIAFTILAVMQTALLQAQVDVLYLYNSNVNQTGTTVTDMCAAISLAANKYPGLTLDARGFTGMQYCSASNATTMLSGSSTTNTVKGVQGKLLLGNVTMVVDAPDPNGGTPYYQDGNGSTYGTPAIIIPNQYWGIQGLSRFATSIQLCTAPQAPVSQCNYAFPQRVLNVNSTSLPGGSTTMTVNVSQSLTSGVNISVGEYVHIVGNANPGLPVSLRCFGTFSISNRLVLSMQNFAR